MIQVKNKEIKTADFEDEFYKAMKSVDNLKHATDAAKEEVRKILKHMHENLVRFELYEIEIPEFMNRRENGRD